MAILGLSTRATNALDRVGVTTVRQLLDLPVGDVRFMRGVGKKTRDEIIAALDHLRKRFPKPPERPGGAEVARRTEPEDPATLDLDALRRKLLGAAPGSRGRQGGQDPRAVPGPLRRGGLADPVRGLGERLEVTRQRIGQVVGADRERWAREPAVTALRAELLRTVQAAGGVMALPELADALAAARGTALEAPDDRRRLASALVRLAFETEQGMASPRLHLRRAGRVAAAGLHARAGRVRRAAGPGGRRDRGREPAAAAPAGLPAALRGRASPSSRPSARRRTTSGSSAWPPPPATAPRCRPGRNSTRRDMDARRALHLGLGALTGLEVERPRPQGRAVRPPGHPRADRRPLPRGRAAARPARAGRPAPRGRPRRDLGRDDDHVPAAGRVAARHLGFVAAADHRVRLVARVEAAGARR